MGTRIYHKYLMDNYMEPFMDISVKDQCIQVILFSYLIYEIIFVRISESLLVRIRVLVLVRISDLIASFEFHRVIFMWIGFQVADGAVLVEASDAGGLQVVAIVGYLQLPRVGACRFHEFLLGVLPKRECPLLDRHSLEDVEAIDIVNLHDESRQATELPRPTTNGDVGREPRHVVTSTPMAGGSLAAVTQNIDSPPFVPRGGHFTFPVSQRRY